MPDQQAPERIVVPAIPDTGGKLADTWYEVDDFELALDVDACYIRADLHAAQAARVAELEGEVERLRSLAQSALPSASEVHSTMSVIGDGRRTILAEFVVKRLNTMLKGTTHD